MADDKNIEMTIHNSSGHSDREPERATKDKRSGSYDNPQLDVSRDAHNQCNRNQPIDFDYYKIAPSDYD